MKKNWLLLCIILITAWTACLGQGIRYQTPYIVEVQRQAYRELAVCDTLKFFVKLLLNDIDSLNLRIGNLKALNHEQKAQIADLEQVISNTNQQRTNDSIIIETLQHEIHRNRLWVLLGKGTVKVVIPVGIAVLGYQVLRR
jgi:hypothetical protein